MKTESSQMLIETVKSPTFCVCQSEPVTMFVSEHIVVAVNASPRQLTTFLEETFPVLKSEGGQTEYLVYEKMRLRVGGYWWADEPQAVMLVRVTC